MFKKKSETKKLFYDKYLYCGHFASPLSGIFRDKTLVTAKKILDTLYNIDEKAQKKTQISTLRARLPLYVQDLLDNNKIKSQDLKDASVMYRKLVDSNNVYTTRQIHTSHTIFNTNKYYHTNLRIYTNNITMLNDIASQEGCARELMSPTPQNILLLQKKPNAIISAKSDFKYKIRFNHHKIHPNFLKWYSSNKDKIKIPYLCVSDIKRWGRIENRFIYVKDDKTLTLLHLMLDSSISKIYECVSPANLDK